MIVIVNTDSNIQGDESVTRYTEETVDSVLGRFSKQITRVEVHLSDINAGRTGDHDKRCVIEARLEGRQPMTVDNVAASVNLAINGAAHKLKRALDTSLGRLAG